jgi:serine/threonine-protein kinase
VPAPLPAEIKEPSAPPATRPAPTTKPTTAEPVADVRTFTSRGGAIKARCPTAGKAELVSWTPEDPYRVQKVTEGPALAAVIDFKSGASRIRMTVTCLAGTPTVATLSL